jgi:hypothetical protein
VIAIGVVLLLFGHQLALFTRARRRGEAEAVA